MASEERWQREQEFFDNENYARGPIPASTIERYLRCRKPYLSAEYPFWALGDLRGKRVLEIGSGDGGNSILLALRGAEVVGIDISPRAVSVARERARLHGVEARLEFHAMPLEKYLERAGGRFDCICGFGILHHLTPVLDMVMRQLKTLAHEGTVYLFVEPVSLAGWLRRLRLALPLAAHGTPDERPLEKRDFAILRQHLPAVRMRLFCFLLRPWERFVGGRYEDYPAWKRAVHDVLGWLDRALLSLPGLRVLGAVAVLRAGPEPEERKT